MRELGGAKVVFFDFDGVIKESVEVKTDAYCQLFERFGEEMARRVKAHHEANGGMSRFEKIPLYLDWCGSAQTTGLVKDYCNRFSRLVTDRVVDAPWVPGVEAYLRGGASLRQKFILVSATPDDELHEILRRLELVDCFSRIYGASTTKSDAIRESLDDFCLNGAECLMIGDALSDYSAARATQVPFLLRKHASNAAVFKDYDGPTCRDFSGIVNVG